MKDLKEIQKYQENALTLLKTLGYKSNKITKELNISMYVSNGHYVVHLDIRAAFNAPELRDFLESHAICYERGDGAIYYYFKI